MPSLGHAPRLCPIGSVCEPMCAPELAVSENREGTNSQLKRSCLLLSPPFLLLPKGLGLLFPRSHPVTTLVAQETSIFPYANPNP